MAVIDSSLIKAVGSVYNQPTGPVYLGSQGMQPTTATNPLFPEGGPTHVSPGVYLLTLAVPIQLNGGAIVSRRSPNPGMISFFAPDQTKFFVYTTTPGGEPVDADFCFWVWSAP